MTICVGLPYNSRECVSFIAAVKPHNITDPVQRKVLLIGVDQQIEQCCDKNNLHETR